jgi:ATP-dependent Clp protease ATP-binding subunit ClpA
LDEIEKADKKGHNLLLTILDEGYLTDFAGKKVNFKHTFIIGTSNAAASFIWELVGQGVTGEDLQKRVVDYVLQENLFSPELLNRFDGVVVFEPLTRDNLLKVAGLMAGKLADNLKKRGITLNVTDALLEKLATDGYDPTFGARPMRRIIDLVLGDLIGNALLKDEIGDGDTITIVPEKTKDTYSLQKT